MVRGGFEPQCPSPPFMYQVYWVHIWLDTSVHACMQVCTHSTFPFPHLSYSYRQTTIPRGTHSPSLHHSLDL